LDTIGYYWWMLGSLKEIDTFLRSFYNCLKNLDILQVEDTHIILHKFEEELISLHQLAKASSFQQHAILSGISDMLL